MKSGGRGIRGAGALAGQSDPTDDGDQAFFEVKSTEHLPPTAICQLDNYLKGTGLEVGLLLHFGPQAKFYRRIRTDRTKLPTTND